MSAASAVAQSVVLKNAQQTRAPVPGLQLQLRLDLGERATRALESGLVLGLAVDWQLDDGRELHDTLWLRYSPLLRRYDFGIGSRPPQSFGLRNALLAAVENARVTWPEAHACKLECGGRVRVRLDVSTLPAPLRLPALFQRDWKLDSGWRALDR